MSCCTVDNATKANGTTTKTEPRNTIAPAVDIVELENEVMLIADVPGVSAEGLNIEVENGQLTIEGRIGGTRENEPNYLVRERRAGTYLRTFELSDRIKADAITAEIRHGRLTVHLPKAEAAKPRRVTVKIA